MSGTLLVRISRTLRIEMGGQARGTGAGEYEAARKAEGNPKVKEGGRTRWREAEGTETTRRMEGGEKILRLIFLGPSGLPEIASGLEEEVRIDYYVRSTETVTDFKPPILVGWRYLL
jgi:hypothetical protein